MRKTVGFLSCSSKCLKLKKEVRYDQVEIPNEIRMPNQVEVPYGVIQLLVSYIPNYVDHLSFKAVCKLWRLVESEHPAPPANLPWLMLSCSDGTRKFYEICSRNFYVNPIPQVESSAMILGSYSDGWLFCYSDSPKELFLHDVYSGEKRSIPIKTILCLNLNPLGQCESAMCEWIDMGQKTHISIVKSVFSCSPSSKGYLVASLNRHGCSLTVSRPDSNNSHQITVHLGGQGFLAIIFYRGELIGIDKSKSVYSIGIEDDAKGSAQVTNFVKHKMKKFNFPRTTSHTAHLVEISGKLLMVVRHYGGSGCASTSTVGFKLYELVWNSLLEWVEVKSLQDHVIFFDSYIARVFHASHFPGINGDHIYFTSYSELFDTGVFSIREQSISHILSAEHFSTHSKPIWLFPPNWQIAERSTPAQED